MDRVVCVFHISTVKLLVGFFMREEKTQGAAAGL